MWKEKFVCYLNKQQNAQCNDNDKDKNKNLKKKKACAWICSISCAYNYVLYCASNDWFETRNFCIHGKELNLNDDKYKQNTSVADSLQNNYAEH